MSGSTNARSLFARVALAVAACPLALASAAGEAPHMHLPTNAAAHAGEILVRVQARTPAELDRAIDAASSVVSCRPSLARTDLTISPADLARLAQSGVRSEVLHTDVSVLIAQEQAQIAASRLQRGADWYETYKTQAEFEAKIDALAAAYPALVTIETIGNSIQGKPIRMMRITAPGGSTAKPQILFNGCQHAREWVSPATVMFIAEELMSSYGSRPETTAALDGIEFLIVPMVNPDGYEYSWTNQRLWRKNRRNNGNGTTGVDLNRNWAYEWGGTGSSGSGSSDTYRGTSPFSEPETQALRDLIIAEPGIRAHVDFHSFSQLVLWPFGYDFVDAPEPDKSLFEELGTEMSDAIFGHSGFFYDPIRSSDLYPAAGDASDWVYGDQGVFSYTFELRDTGLDGFELPAEFIRPTVEENFEAVLVMSDFVTEPVRVSQTSPEGGFAAPNALVPISVDVLPVFESATDVTLHQRVGSSGAFDASSLSASGATWSGMLTTGACGEAIEYYLEITTDQGLTVLEPAGGAMAPATMAVLDSELGLFDDAEIDTGWTVGASGDTASTGIWELANPVGTAAQPEDDHTPSGTLCWVTGASATSLGSNDIDNGGTTLVSPPMDAATAPSFDQADAYVSYSRWYSNDQGQSPNADEMVVSISGDNGSTWQTLETVRSNANAWVRAEFRVADFVTPSDQVRLRFVASDIGGGSIVEAAIDDVAIDFRGCEAVSACVADVTTTGTANGTPDGAVDLSDFSYYLSLWSAAATTADVTTTGTANGVPDGSVDLSDFSYYLSLWSAGCP